MSFSQHKEKSPAELLSVLHQALNRYWRIAVGPAIVICGLSVIVALVLPTYYSSKVLLLIQPSRVSSKIVEMPSKNAMREQLEAVAQDVLSRPRLRTIIERFNLYPHLRGPGRIEIATTNLRNKILITPVTTATGMQLLQLFQIEFSHHNPSVTFEIVKAVSNLFIEESLLGKRNETQGTEEFLEMELRKAREKLETTENEVQQFVRENFSRLPEHLDTSITRLENMQAQFQTNKQVLSANVDRKVNLLREIKDLNRRGQSSTTSGDAKGVGTLADLETSLIALKSRYSPMHPDIMLTEQRISALKTQKLKHGKTKPRMSYKPNENSSLSWKTQQRLNELNVQSKTLEKDNELLASNISKLQTDIEAMPIAEQQLIKIRRDYKSVKANYARLLAAKGDASLHKSLVRSQKHAQFKIVDPPERPFFPSGPHRPIIMGTGIIISCVSFVTLCLLSYFFNFAYKSREDLEEETGISVIGVIPPMQTKHSNLKRQRATAIAVLISAVFFASGSLLINYVLKNVI